MYIGVFLTLSLEAYISKVSHRNKFCYFFNASCKFIFFRNKIYEYSVSGRMFVDLVFGPEATIDMNSPDFRGLLYVLET